MRIINNKVAVPLLGTASHAQATGQNTLLAHSTFGTVRHSLRDGVKVGVDLRIASPRLLTLALNFRNRTSQLLGFRHELLTRGE